MRLSRCFPVGWSDPASLTFRSSQGVFLRAKRNWGTCVCVLHGQYFKAPNKVRVLNVFQQRRVKSQYPIMYSECTFDILQPNRGTFAVLK